jgi:hypothetical protein
MAKGILDHELLGPCPCDNCRHVSRCGATGEACLAFFEYQKTGKGWLLMPKQPRADLGVKLGYRLKETA